MSSSPEFSKLRAFLWPIYRHELKKFIPMMVIFFLICFNYNILRAAKDTLVVTAPSSGAEALPFLKVWAVLPMAFLSTWLFSKFSNKLPKEQIFYTVIGLFLVFFFLFAFVLYPYRDALHPNLMADSLEAILPKGFFGLISIFRNWTTTAFYIAAEMWSTLVMTILFWGFANDTTSVKDARRHYALLGIGANLSAILSGEATQYLSKTQFHLPFISSWDNWGQSIILLNGIIILSGLVIMALFYQIHKEKLGYNAPHVTVAEAKAPKIKMGLRENFAYLAKSRYLIALAIIVVTYNISINLVEVVWKDQIKMLYPNPNDFNAYMGSIQTATGIIATTTAVFISGNIIRKCSWTVSAMITPAIMLFTGIWFFAFNFFQDSGLSVIAGLLGSTPLILSAFFGSLQNCLARACKYTFFDTTKELAFIPLSNECKLKGKAAIDGVGSRLGKSGGSMIHQGLLISLGSVSLSAPYVAGVLGIVIVAWVFAIKSLGKKFNEIVAKNEKLDIDHSPGLNSPEATEAPGAGEPSLSEEYQMGIESPSIKEEDPELQPL